MKHKIRPIEIDDLLPREKLNVNTSIIDEELRGKRLLVTGAAGSIGKELSRLIASYNPALLILCDCAESALYSLELEFNEQYNDLNYTICLGDIRDRNRMDFIFSQYKPEIVYHAAAYKHVPMLEKNPTEAVLANVLGTKNIADLSITHQVDRFVMISTDKAVNPGNIMGVTKRVAEIYIQSLYNRSNSSKLPGKEMTTKFITTRFGNVLGSNGSVVPYFKSQIEKGGPVTVTHPEIIRYFMTISEACSLVLEASVVGHNCEVFVFDMGQPVKILDLAERMIRLSGFIPHEEIKIEYIGLRPGEKLYEELLTNKESMQVTVNNKIWIANVESFEYSKVAKMTNELILLAKTTQDTKAIINCLKSIVPEYVSADAKPGNAHKKIIVNSNCTAI